MKRADSTAYGRYFCRGDGIGPIDPGFAATERYRIVRESCWRLGFGVIGAADGDAAGEWISSVKGRRDYYECACLDFHGVIAAMSSVIFLRRRRFSYEQ